MDGFSLSEITDKNIKFPHDILFFLDAPVAACAMCVHCLTGIKMQNLIFITFKVLKNDRAIRKFVNVQFDCK